MDNSTLNDDLIAEIEAAAKAATPGQWGADGSFVCTSRTEGGTTYVETWSGVADANRAEDTRYIAKANPANVLALIARVRELEKDAARYRFLSKRMLGVDFDWQESGETCLYFKMPQGVSYGVDCDRNIDDAMSKPA